jgi:hypothetical protein
VLRGELSAFSFKQDKPWLLSECSLVASAFGGYGSVHRNARKCEKRLSLNSVVLSNENGNILFDQHVSNFEPEKLRSVLLRLQLLLFGS